MIDVKDLQKAYEEKMSDRDKSIINEFENFIDSQLVKTNGKSKITKWDFLMVVDKAIGGLTTKDYIIFKKAFECVCVHYYTEETTLLRYMLKKYRDSGYTVESTRGNYLLKPYRNEVIFIDK